MANKYLLVEYTSLGKDGVYVPLKETFEKGLAGKANKIHSHDLASATANGFMSSKDKSKLDSLHNYSLKAATATELGGVMVAAVAQSGLVLGTNGSLAIDNDVAKLSSARNTELLALLA